MADKQFLNPLYQQQNQLRAIRTLAKEVETKTGISVMLFNVGDPTGPTAEESNEAMVSYIRKRGPYTGYADHRGEEQQRERVANALKKINRLEGAHADVLTADKIFCVDGGTGALNVALSLFAPDSDNPKASPPAVLGTDPAYPPWESIIKRNGGQMIRFPLRKEDNYLLNEDIIREKIQEALVVDPNRPVVLMYHYPHNPTGKILSEPEARAVADTLNNLVASCPNLHLIQEDLYLATTASDKGIYTPLSYLSDEAMSRTMWVHSPSKEGHGQDRGAIIATSDPTLAKHLEGATAFDALGMATVSLHGTAETLENIAEGVEPRNGKPSLVRNHRYTTADYYQARMKALAKGFTDLEEVLDRKGQILEGGVPQGTYYLWPSLKCMKGKEIPEEMRDLFDHDTITSTQDVQLMLAHAYRLGLRPMTVAPGEIFSNPNEDFHIRLAAVDRRLETMYDAANTLRGVIGRVMGVEEKLAVTYYTMDELRERYPAKPDPHAGFLKGLNMPSGFGFEDMIGIH